ncbi:metallopeptidase family M24 containing protein [Wuchereria bancrofti]|uniref:Metallopeptidase family M24 containing protein n=1 Tax=Wuchereria bancrofti TaxID=6293 RepID=J9DWK7_WUCBA|nr:metallopeptidase family M24 containing protein [Wuchereria bancrofti]
MTPDEVHLFISKRKLNNEILDHLASIIIHEYSEASEWIEKWLRCHKGQYKVCIPDSTNYELGSLVESDDGIILVSPIQFTKAIKNETELNGMRQSSIRDSAAIIEYLVWLEEQIAAGKEITEVLAGEKMDTFRSRQPLFVDLSFKTIAALNEHAALPHYQSTSTTSKQLLTNNCIFLIDSGGHYRDGTTDVTRTIAFPDNKDNELLSYGLLNIRGSDIPYNPVVYAIIFMTPDEVHLFISKRKLNNEILDHLASIIIHEYSEASEWIEKWLRCHKGQYKVS